MKEKRHYDRLDLYQVEVIPENRSLLESSVETLDKKFTVKTENYEVEDYWYDTDSHCGF